MIRCRQSIWFCIFVAWSLLVLSVGPLRAADPFSLAETKDKHLDVRTPAGKSILRYVYARDTSTPETTFDTSKVFAHVIAPNGVATITKGPGGLYGHHRGIFIGWSKLKHGGKTHDLWHARDTSQLHHNFIETNVNDRGASITSTINWIGNHGEQVIEETRTYRLVTQEEAYAVIDFISDLKAVNGDVTLDGDPEHAGVQFRPSQQVAENKSAQYIFHTDGIDPREQLDLPWVAETFRVDNQLWTVQHMSHPSNPKGARWSAYRDYGRFGPFNVLDISNGDKQRFRYRFRITSGNAPPRDHLAEQYGQFSEGP